MSDDKIQWIDISQYGARLCVLELPNDNGSRKHLSVAPMASATAEQIQMISEIGQALGMKGRDLGGKTVFIDMNSTTINRDEIAKKIWQAGFKNIKPGMFDNDQVFLNVGRPKPKPAPVEKTPTRNNVRAEILKRSESIGHNKLGEEVFEIKSGENSGKRFLLGNGLPLIEGNEDLQPGLLLRAVDKASLKDCAAAFGADLEAGRVKRLSNLQAFSDTVFGRPADHEQVSELAAAVENHFAGWMRRNSSKSNKELFGEAVRITENSVYKADLRNENQSTADLNLAISVALHRIGNTLAKDGVKAVFVNPGKGAPFAKWKKGKDGELRIYDTRSEVVENLKTFSRELGLRRDDVVEVGNPVYTDADYIVANVETGWLDEEQYRQNEAFNRREYLEVLDALDARKTDGNAIFAIPMKNEAKLKSEYANFLEYLGRRYTVEGIAEVDSSVHSSISGEEKLVILSVGDKRPVQLKEAPEPSLRRREIYDTAALYNWTSEVLKARAKISSYLDDMEVTETYDGLNANDADRNAYQAPYVSGSRASEPETMCPKHLEGPMREAMARMIEQVQIKYAAKGQTGDIDTYVSDNIGIEKKDLGKFFSAEQVDAMALEAHGEERGQRGFHIADQTGVGKGRTAAGIAMRHLLLGRNVFMGTAKSANIQDIIRDLGDTGALQHASPIIFNSGSYSYTNKETGEEYNFSGLSADEALEALVEFEPLLDEEGDPQFGEDDKPLGTFRSTPLMDANLVIATYSQLSGKLEKLEEEEPHSMKAAKLRWFIEQIDDNTVLILDEAQNATGASNTGKNFQEAIDNANRTVFLSATHAKDAKTMRLYSILFPEHLTADDIQEILKKGGETALEAATASLAANGMYLRREHDNSRISIQNYVDEENMDFNWSIADAVSPIWAEIAYLSGEVNSRLQNRVEAALDGVNDGLDRLDELREQNAAQAEIRAVQRENTQRRQNIRKLQNTRIGLGSPLFRIQKNLFAALKSDLIARKAVDDLNNGKKPTIVADSVQGALFEEMYLAQEFNRESEDFQGGRTPKLKDFVRREVANIFAGVLQVPDFEENDDQRAERLNLEPQVAAILQLVDGLPDLEISMIDSVKRRVTEAGYTIGEITGRAYEVDFEAGEIVRRKKPRPQDEVSKFNSGEYDALLASSPGLVGLSYHHSKQFEDQRPRSMHFADTPLDIVIFMQALGRIFRKGSLSDPEFTIYNTGIPVESRATSSLMSKLRKLNANTSSNRDSNLMAGSSMDMFNSVGDNVCSEYFDDYPEYLPMMGLNDGQFEEARDINDETEVSDVRRSASQIVGRLGLLQCAVQDRILGELVAEYDARIIELDADNKNPLKPKRLEGVIKRQRRTLFQGPDAEISQDAFDAPVYLSDCILEQTKDPFTGEEVDSMVNAFIERNHGISNMLQVDRLEGRRIDRLSSIARRTPGVTSVEEALAQQGTSKNRIQLEDIHIDQMQEMLKTLVPGAQVRFGRAGEPMIGVVIETDYPTGDVSLFSTGKYRLKIAVPGLPTPQSVNFDQLLFDKYFFQENEAGTSLNFNVWQGLNDPSDERVEALMKQFDNARKFKMQSRVQLLEGNDWVIMEILENNKRADGNIGGFIEYEDAETGQVNRAAYLYKDVFEARRIPVPLRTPEMVYDALKENTAVQVTPANNKNRNALRVTRVPRGFEVQMPSKRSRAHGYIYANEFLNEFYDLSLGDKNPPKGDLKVIIPHQNEAQLLNVLRAISAEGFSYTTAPALRDWANGWMTRKNIADQNTYAQDNEPDMAPEPQQLAQAG